MRWELQVEHALCIPATKGICRTGENSQIRGDDAWKGDHYEHQFFCHYCDFFLRKWEEPSNFSTDWSSQKKWQMALEAHKPLDESERGEWKSWLNAQHSENEDHGIRSHHFMGNRWGNSVRLYFFGLQKSLQMVIAAMKLKDTYSLEEKLWPT